MMFLRHLKMNGSLKFEQLRRIISNVLNAQGASQSVYNFGGFRRVEEIELWKSLPGIVFGTLGQ